MNVKVQFREEDFGIDYPAIVIPRKGDVLEIDGEQYTVETVVHKIGNRTPATSKKLANLYFSEIVVRVVERRVII